MIERVFLIDDSELDLFISRSVIQQAKYSSTVVDFLVAGQALEYLRNIGSSHNQAPDIIFLDINMPLLNGFGFLKEFETLPDAIKQKVKIVMLSSSSNPSDIERSAEYPSVIKYLNKPLSAQKLKEL